MYLGYAAADITDLVSDKGLTTSAETKIIILVVALGTAVLAMAFSAYYTKKAIERRLAHVRVTEEIAVQERRLVLIEDGGGAELQGEEGEEQQEEELKRGLLDGQRTASGESEGGGGGLGRRRSVVVVVEEPVISAVDDRWGQISQGVWGVTGEPSGEASTSGRGDGPDGEGEGVTGRGWSFWGWFGQQKEHGSPQRSEMEGVVAGGALNTMGSRQRAGSARKGAQSDGVLREGSPARQEQQGREGSNGAQRKHT